MRTLGVIAPYLMGTYPGALVAALHARAQAAGAAMLLLRTGSQTSSYELDLCLARADAWVVILNPVSAALLSRIQASGSPVCVISHDYGIASFGSVRTDNQAGIFAAMQHLYDRGHRRFAYIGPNNMSDCLERRDAVLAFARQRADCAAPLIKEAADFSYAAGSAAVLELTASGEPFTALITATDNIALGAMTSLRENGVRVPRDVAVVGFDNSIFSRTSSGGVTTLDQSLDHVAALAFDDVWGRLGAGAERAPLSCRVAPVLILRESTGDIDTTAAPQLIDRQAAQAFIAVSEEVGQLTSGGRDAYLRDYLKRLEFRLKFACVARLLEQDKQALVVSALPERSLGPRDAVAGMQIPLEQFPSLPVSQALEPGDFIAVLLQSGLAQGTELMALCFQSRDLSSPLALETLTHEIELLCYHLHVQLMGDDLNRALNTLRATQGELLRSEKQAALGVAVAGVAHELNTPLGNCLLSVSTLSDIAGSTRRKYAEGSLKRADVEDMLATAEAAADILQRNISSALRLVSDFKRLRTEHHASAPETVGLSVFLNDLVTVLRVEARAKGADINCSLDVGRDDRFETHPQLLTQVISELVENALTHAFAEVSAGDIRIAGVFEAERVTISVADNGAGIAREVLHKVFDPFYTTRMGASSGLGLAMVNNLVTGPLKGQIHAEEGRAAGACFIITLPLRF
ncbi:MAG: substrate-binding domain-containing protein [Uliginosibacterium sp.]|nr:substrate-binding domain-containing protein [Uliginosibacterium sp.]